MSDFLLEVRVKNNRIIRRIQSRGFTNIAEFCRANMVSETLLRELVSFKISPRRNDGEWRDVVYDLSSALHCEPEELFSERQLEMIADKNISRIEMDEAALNSAIDNKLALQKLIPCLTPREERVIRMRFYDKMTLNEVGDELGVCGQRIRDIEGKAMRRLKIRASKLKKEQTISNLARHMDKTC